MKHATIISIGLLSLTIVSSSANAADNKNTNADSPLSFLYECAEISDVEQRLKCYDTKVGRLRIAEQNKEIVAVDVKVAQKIKKEAFGFHMPSLGKLGLPKLGSDKNIDAVTLKVKSIRTAAFKHIITLENGQVWKEVGPHQKRLPKGDLTAIIKSKTLGSFMLSLNNGKYTSGAMRVRRMR